MLFFRVEGDAFERKSRVFMSSDKNFSDSLVEELLVDVAGAFFATRKHLEEMMDMLQSFVKTLREKEAEVASRAGFLHYLLLYGREADDFYKSIKVDSVAIVSESKFSDKAIPEKIPFAFTARGKFIKLVLWAYDVLQKTCDEYINGKDYDDPDEKMGRGITIHYNQIVIMCELINKEVFKVNRNMSPADTLQYAKKFNHETAEKEYVTGGTFAEYAYSIDKKLAYQPIDFDLLKLKRYPELPAQDKAIFEITSFCKRKYSYSNNKDEIKKLISDLKKRIQRTRTN